MATLQEYSLLAAAVYNDARGEFNKLDVTPLGWTAIAGQSDTTGGVLSSGLSITAYQKGSEIVIACKGTDFLIGSNNSQTASDLIADLALGGSLGFSSSQLFQAALFYEQVKEQNPSATITFTGHSLGAGLASILSVWFNQKATIFADAPFEATALNPLVMGYVAGYLALKGYSDPEFVNFIASYVVTYGARESQVTSYYVNGEVLNNWLGLLPFVVGTNNVIDIGGGDQLSPLTLHSVVLHSSLLISDQLRQDTFILPNLLARIFDDKLYAAKLESKIPDFLTKLLSAQIPLVGGDMSSGKLTHFAEDMNKLGTSIAGLNTAAQDALIAQGIEWYYWQGADYAGQAFFTAAGDLLQYTTAAGAGLSGAQDKAASYVDKWLTPLFNANNEFGGNVNYAQWNVVVGSAAAVADALDPNKTQIYIGNTGGDGFTGGNLSDALFGGDGGDTLNGGAGNDKLYGGAGADTYLFRDAFGHDTITDTDGSGVITINGATLIGGKKLSENVWQSDDKQTVYTVMGGNLVIGEWSSNGGSITGTVTVNGWQAGQLGIDLEDSPVDVAQPTNTLTGDDPAHAPNVNDNLAGTANPDLIKGLTGSDLLMGLAGNDSIEGGIGSDILMGGLGADTLNGGDGDDLIYGSSNGGLLSSSPDTSGTTIAQGDGWRWSTDGVDDDGFRRTYLGAVVRDEQFGDDGNVIDGGAGNDIIASGTGDDIVHGGDGADDIKGMGGADVLMGDAGDDRIYGDGPADNTYSPVTYTPPEQQGSDFIDGGDGNDILLGQGGDDVVYGGSGNDKIWGDDRDPLNTPVAVHGNDYLDGEDGDDTIVGGGKDDTIYGGLGNDQLWGDSGNLASSDPGYLDPSAHGNDYLDGEEGDDQLMGEGANDTLYGGAGDDAMWGDDDGATLPAQANGQDYLDGEDGNDTLYGGGSDDTLYGGAGNDGLHGDADHLAGNDHGNDYLDGEDGDDGLAGDGGNDTLYGGAGNDGLLGDNNTLDAQYHGDDYLDGGDGDDTLIGGGGSDTLIGGLGNDQLFGDGGSAGADFALQYHGNDYIDGGDGDDQLVGGGGADTLVGGTGNDTLFGDANGATGDAAGNDDLDGGDGDDQLAGGGGTDMLSGGAGNDLLWGEDGNDFLDGGSGNDQLQGGDGDDTLDGGGGDDSLWGGAGDDTLVVASAGNSRLSGGDGDDVLQGGDANDMLDGGAGNDTLFGGAGIDQLNGGTGDDTYVFGAGDSPADVSAAELIYDTDGVNHLQLNGVSIGNINLTSSGIANVMTVQTGQMSIGVYGLTTGAIGSIDVGGISYSAGEFFGDTYGGVISQTSSASGSTLQGGKGTDTLTATGGNATLAGGQGDDTLSGSGGHNVYLYNGGDGADTINDTSTALDSHGQPQTSTLKFGAGITPDMLVLGTDGGALVIGFGTAQPGAVRLTGFNAGNALQATHVGLFQFSDGTVLTHAQLVARGFDISGTAASETLTGTNLADRLTGGAGSDTLTGGAGADIYTFNVGDGADVIADGDSAGGGGDTLRFGPGILAANLLALRNGGDVSFIAGSDSVTLRGYFSGGADAVEQIQFADGTQWSQSNVLALVQASASHDFVITGDAGDNLLYGFGGNDLLDGAAGSDTLHGGPGNDTLTGGAGVDFLYGEAGSDTYVVNRASAQEVIDEGSGGDASGVDTLQFTDSINQANITAFSSGDDLRIYGSGFDVTVVGEFAGDSPAGQIERFVFADGSVMTAQDMKGQLLRSSNLADNLNGFGSSDALSGGWGDDFVYGWGGNDTLHGDQGNDSVSGGVGNDQLFGDAGNDTLSGGDGDDTLEGGAGWDRLDGGAGNDQYNFGLGQGMDIVVADASGVDRVQLAAGVTAANVTLHRISSPPAADLNFKGDSLVIQLNGGSDQLWIANYFDPASPGNIESIRFADGTTWDASYIAAHLSTQGGTANTLTGTNKANTFVVDNWNDVISDSFLNDGDKVSASVSYRLPETITDLTLTGTVDLFGVGTSASDVLRGNSGANWFDFTMGQGYDTLAGGQGDDVYRVAGQGESLQPGMRASLGGAVITELAGEGTDTLISGFWSATLPDYVENLVLGTPNPMSNGYGYYPWSYTDYSHKLVGNALNNVLDASTYESQINTLAIFSLSNNASFSSISDFRLDGGTGADTMIGGVLNDTYVIDNAGDTVVELGVSNGGDYSNDTVETPFETSLLTQYPNVENVTLTGASAVNATGNATNNRLDGSHNTAANRLAGGAGDDTYVVGAGDTVVELAGEGADTVVVASAGGAATVQASTYANIEAIRLQADAGALNVQGDGRDNSITGSLANNQLIGGAGDDTLTDQFLGDITFAGGVAPAADNDLLQGGDGNDTLLSRGGVDTLDGGAGDDTLQVRYTGRNVTVNMGLADGHDRLYQDYGTTVTVTLQLKADIGPGDVQLQRGAGLITATLADGTTLDLQDTDALSLGFADGTLLGATQVAAMLASSDRSTATQSDDVLFGTAGADTISALGGADAVYAGTGADLLDGGAGNDSLFGGAGADTLTGGSGNDVLAGGTGADVYRLARGFGQDVIDDNLTGGTSHAADDGAVDAVEFDATVASTDIAVYQQISGTTPTGLVLAIVPTGDEAAIQNEYAAGGAGAVDLVRFSNGTQWDLATLKTKVAGLVGSDNGNDTLTAPVVNSWLEARGGNDTLNGGSGNDTLDGGTGNDVMIGGAGNDIFYVDSVADQVIEASSGGTDTVIESVDNYALPVQIEKLQLAGGTAPLHATGNSLANAMTGNAGNNWLDGGAGNDTMAGGLGDDTYVLDSSGDVVTEATGEGSDTVQSAVSYTLGANLENLVLTGTSRLSGTGNALDNVLIGNSTVNSLSGGAGNDRLDGGAGADAMTGGPGNDTYVVDNTSDTTVEASAGGIDTIETALTWTLGTEVERLTLTGTALVNGTGNASNNWLAGNSAANTLNGAAGADALLGGGGNDILQDTTGNGALDGGAGNDTLTTGVGNDLLGGGTGNDTYTLGGGADIVAFNFGDGADTVNAPTSGAGLGESNDTVSLGGIRLADITFSRVGSDLVLKVNGTADSLSFKGWYLAAGDQTVTKLQVVIDSSSDYAPGTADTLRSSRIVTLNFTQLVAAYDSARASNASLINWAPPDTTLQAARLGASDTLALGGNLAYRYAHDDTLASVSYDAITQQLTTTGFGTSAQAIADFAPLQMAPAAGLASVAQLETTATDSFAPVIDASAPEIGLDGQLQNLVQAMAAFAPSAAGLTTSPSSYQYLETTIVANWQ